MVSINVSVSMPPEMLQEIDEAVEENSNVKSRAHYVREAIRDCPATPFEGKTGQVLDNDDEAEKAEAGAA